MNEVTQLVLDAIAGKRANLKNIVRANCPFCESAVHKVDRKACLSVSIESGYWKCYRCDTKGRLGEDDLPFDLSTIKKTVPGEEKPAVNLPEGFTGLWLPEGKALALAQAHRYLASRVGVTDRIIKAARIGACARGKFKNRVVVPIYKEGKLAGYVGRLWWKKPPKGSLTYRYSNDFDRASCVYNEEAIYVTTREPLIVVEGVFDTYPFWPNASALLGKASPAQVEMFAQARRPILIVLDGDAHREATALAMGLRFRGKEAAALRLPPGFDPDEMVDHVKERAKAAFAAKGAA